MKRSFLALSLRVIGFPIISAQEFESKCEFSFRRP